MTKESTDTFWPAVLRGWSRAATAIALALALFVGLVAPAAAQDATPVGTPASATPASGTPTTLGSGVLGLGDADITATVNAMLAVQADDGGFVGFSGESDPGVTTDAVIALAAAEAAGVDTGEAIDGALGYLEDAGSEYAAVGAGQGAKLVLAVAAAGEDPGSFGGEDIWAPIEASDDDTDLVVTGSFSLALVVLAATAVDSGRTAEFTDLLVGDQLEDGSWASFTDAVPGDGDTNTTALAIQALVAAGDVEDPAIASGLSYLMTVRAADGGYAYQPTADGSAIVPDANSTALVLQALIATMAPEDEAAFQQDADALAGFQNGSGQFRYTDDMPDDNLFATVQALPAIVGLALPIAA